MHTLKIERILSSLSIWLESSSRSRPCSRQSAQITHAVHQLLLAIYFDGLLHTGRRELREQLAAVGIALARHDSVRPETTWEFLTALDTMEHGGSPAPLGAPFEVEALERWIDGRHWEELAASSDLELYTLPDSATATLCRSLAWIGLGEYANAAREAELAAEIFPSRHPKFVASAAHLLDGSPESAVRAAFEGHQRRISVNYPEPRRGIIIPQVEQEFEKIVIKVHCAASRLMIDNLSSSRHSDPQISLWRGLLNPDVSQMSAWLQQAAERREDLAVDEQVILKVGEAICARLQGRTDQARRCLDELRSQDSPLIESERMLIERDSLLMAAREIEFNDAGVQFKLFRTSDSVGSEWFSDGSFEHDRQAMPTCSEFMLADRLRRQAAEWISSGFGYAITRSGPPPNPENESGGGRSLPAPTTG